MYVPDWALVVSFYVFSFLGKNISKFPFGMHSLRLPVESFKHPPNFLFDESTFLFEFKDFIIKLYVLFEHIMCDQLFYYFS